MVFCIGRRRLLLVLTLLLLSLLIMTVNHYLSTSLASRNVDDFYASRDEEPGNSWRLVSHEVDEEDEQDNNQNFQPDLTKITFQKSLKGVGSSKEKQNTGNLMMEKKRYIPEHRVVHLDLKGAPPKISYLKNLFPLLKDAGATALLIEYEDMFPYWGPLRNISAKNTYSPQDIQSLNKFANQNDLIVIPLIQTFGHMEFVLKLEEFKQLRENPTFPQSLCPSQDEGWTLVSQMIDQVLSLHPDSKWLHIGCDEVYQLNQCSLCTERMSKKTTSEPTLDGIGIQGNEAKLLFLEHVQRVSSYVFEKKDVIPIIWDDMLRNIPLKSLQASGIGNYVEPMVWVYVEDIDRFIDANIWNTYGEVFKHMWAASAFKGAFGERMYVANIQRHTANQLAWLEVMRRETAGTNHLTFRGLALTGWSRYDHFAVLCELLPAALPSLVMSLAIVSQGGHDFEAVRKTHRILQCSPRNALLTPEELRRSPYQWDLHRCRFPGSNFLGLLGTYKMNVREVEMAANRINEREGWMTQYNMDHKFSSPFRVQEMMRPLSYLPGSLRSLESQFEKTLSIYFDWYTVDEWIEQHVKPLTKTMDDINNRATVLTSVSSWPRRPLGKNKDTKRKTNEIENNHSKVKRL